MKETYEIVIVLFFFGMFFYLLFKAHLSAMKEKEITDRENELKARAEKEKRIKEYKPYKIEDIDLDNLCFVDPTYIGLYANNKHTQENFKKLETIVKYLVEENKKLKESKNV